MPAFKGIIERYATNKEKSGWTFISIPPDIIISLRLKSKKGFRIKGSIDDVAISKLSTYPVGEGNFIIALNKPLLKKLGKDTGAGVMVKFEPDNSAPPASKELISCLEAEPGALAQFNSYTPSHRQYFHNYVLSAKGQDTRAQRIVNTINAMLRKQNFGEMIRSLKKGTSGSV